MKHLTVTIEDEVYLACRQLIAERQLSNTVNEFLRNFTGSAQNEFYEEKSELTKEKEVLNKKLTEIHSKLIIMEEKERKVKKKTQNETLKVLEGMRRNNPLRYKI